MWIAALLAAFVFLVWVGRQSRLGRLKPAPWFQQFRTFRGTLGLLFLMLAIGMIWRGAVAPGVITLVFALLSVASARMTPRPRARPDLAVAWTAEQIAAYQLLGLAVGADRKAVIRAWKERMKSAHPDQGGSEARAKALNAARDLLLKDR